jgi:thiol:disulfide interchange protein
MRLQRTAPSAFLLVLLLAGFARPVAAQGLPGQRLEPVQWTASVTPNEDGTYELVFSAAIEDGWKLYDMGLEEGGPIPTSVHFEDSTQFAFAGPWKGLGRKKTEYDPMFDMDIAAYTGKAIFRIPVQAPSGVRLKGYVEYMTCDDAQCIFPDPFAFSLVLTAAPVASEQDETQGMLEPVRWSPEVENLGGGEYRLRFRASIEPGWKLYSQHIPEAEVRPIPTRLEFDGAGERLELLGETAESGQGEEAAEPLFDNLIIRWYKEEAVLEQRIRVSEPGQPLKGRIEYMTCDNSRCIFPDPWEFELDLSSGENIYSGEGGPVRDTWGEFTWLDSSVCAVVEEDNSSWWGVFLKGLLGGLIALFTPCVFPMIPMTVTFFTKKTGQSRAKGIFDASFYGISILAVYLACTIPFVVYKLPPDTLNVIATHPVLNLIFFAIFVFFAFSFFGYYELTLPSSWGTKTDSASQTGGLLGIFFMAVTLAIVSFSCTGPLLGVLLVQTLSTAASQSAIVAGFAGFGVALGLPFALFAAFPRALSALPQSGGWLNSVKVVLGFLELGLALKFLSNADLVAHWGFLKRDLFLLIWILTGLATVAYLLGWIRFPHDSPSKPGPLRLGFAALFAAFSIYLIPGLFGSNLKLISGFPPPMFYSYGWFYKTESKCPLDLPCFKDFDEGLAYARENNKPIMLDFTGWACVNCRKMEEGVWVDQQVFRRLSEDFVLISLYVDDTSPLPDEDRYVSAASGRSVRTVGNKWSDLQLSNFKGVSQPWYVLLGPDGRTVLNEPVGYTPDKRQYLEFLDCGLSNFQNLQAASAGSSPEAMAR